VPAKSRRLSFLDEDLYGRGRFQDGVEIRNELRIVNLTEPCRILFQLRKRFAELGAGTIQIATPEVVHSDRGLNQTLVEKPKRTPSRAPQVLPCLVSFEVSSGVEKIYSVTEEVAQGSYSSKLLKALL